MIQSKTIDLLKTFSVDEWKEFGLFLDSPFHNKDKILYSLYNAIKKFHPEFSSSWLSKEKIFGKIYPGKPYNDSRMRNLLSDLLRSGQEFISVAAIKNDKFKMNLQLIEELIRKDQKKLFKKNYDNLTAEMQKVKILDKTFFEKKQKLNSVELNYKNRYEKSDTMIDEFKLEAYDTLRIQFLLEIMNLEIEISNSARDRFSYGKNLKEREELERFIDVEAKQHNDILYVRYYYNMYKLGRTQGKEYFHKLRDILRNHYEELNDIDKRNIFTALTNYCYYTANKGETDLYRDNFDLYKENIERGYYAMGRYMTHITYFNTVVTGLEVNEFKWVDDFIEKYIYELEEPMQKNAYTFCRALFFYHTKEFEKALETAAGVMSDDMTYKHQLKSLYLKIYYDMNETEPFYSHIDGYKHFINSERYVTATTKPVFLNYINFAKRLFDIKNSIEDKDFSVLKLKKEVLNEKAMINKPWLLKKIDEIESAT